MLKKLACVLLCALMLCVTLSGCSKPEMVMDEYDSLSGEAGYRRTVLYYPSDDGFIVPIMKLIPWEEGIGKAALSYLTDTTDNKISASMMGLKTIIPEGTQVSLQIRDKNAIVNLAKLPELADASTEQQLVTAIVNTLSEFPTIDTVSFTLDGKCVKALPHGTRISGSMSAFSLNIEKSELAVSTDDAYAMTLYFPNKTGSLNVPVTRYTEIEPTLSSRITALIEGPRTDRLMNCFPEGTKLISAEIVNNIAKIDLSADFIAATEQDGMLLAAYDALYLTAAQAGEVYALEIFAQGKPVDMSAMEVSAPMYVNEFK
ncbi:MAG: GerMN domain-containing protein [Clostridia bacterium]